MDPELQKELAEIHALARDTHRLARAIRHHQLIGIVMSVIFWLVLIVTPLYIYAQYLQPLISRFQSTNNTSSGTTSTELQKLLNSFKAGQ